MDIVDLNIMESNDLKEIEDTEGPCISDLLFGSISIYRWNWIFISFHCYVADFDVACVS